jgi:hypothetical protein
LVDQVRGLHGASQRAVDDAVNLVATKTLADGRRLRAPECAELKTVEVPVQNLVRILHVGVANEE